MRARRVAAERAPGDCSVGEGGGGEEGEAAGDCVEREEGDFGLEELPQVRAGRLRCEGGMGGGGEAGAVDEDL